MKRAFKNQYMIRINGGADIPIRVRSRVVEINITTTISVADTTPFTFHFSLFTFFSYPVVKKFSKNLEIWYFMHYLCDIKMISS